MTTTKCFRDAFRDQFHELSGQPNIEKQPAKSQTFFIYYFEIRPVYTKS